MINDPQILLLSVFTRKNNYIASNILLANFVLFSILQISLNKFYSTDTFSIHTTPLSIFYSDLESNEAVVIVR